MDRWTDRRGRGTDRIQALCSLPHKVIKYYPPLITLFAALDTPCHSSPFKENFPSLILSMISSVEVLWMWKGGCPLRMVYWNMWAATLTPSLS